MKAQFWEFENIVCHNLDINFFKLNFLRKITSFLLLFVHVLLTNVYQSNGPFLCHNYTIFLFYFLQTLQTIRSFNIFFLIYIKHSIAVSVKELKPWETLFISLEEEKINYFFKNYDANNFVLSSSETLYLVNKTRHT